ncbi:hypothetical protein BIV57_00015 [Mangrovactinospora gilvigrisea]|uniref:Potassium channel domain-containing protein n=1 Tax=Mangrovactinospora gilvigrisea TaxID=1428644 RepID=A0A1J7CD88_9ACTN|nr:potassium channel family protein [Mangrovactinospora gilvigrisea]OIV39536.1 hypothetical protein BIV57_00015 [Mangrovactinospora gilvigrisea]
MTAARDLPPGAAHPFGGTAALRRYEARTRLPLTVAVLASVIVAPAHTGVFSAVVDLAAWTVLAADLIVHLRLAPGYLRTGLGRLAVAATAVSAPWYLLPGLGAGAYVVGVRLLLLARLATVSRRGRQLTERLGTTTLFAMALVGAASFAAYFAEHPHNAGFRTVGDALWWGVVTFTGTGYGDITPRTAAGRWAGVCIMIDGVATLGIVAGVLAGFFRGRAEDGGPPDGPDPAPAHDAWPGPRA